ncbi:cilia- and flagella-associated protein 251 [Genypterus blacodes]|uniref:cilia- and flagella-associated protein 251 n=1 Tax=Genypterus blacodes TaxID=154954 RepID=UPI003F75BCE2
MQASAFSGRVQWWIIAWSFFLLNPAVESRAESQNERPTSIAVRKTIATATEQQDAESATSSVCTATTETLRKNQKMTHAGAHALTLQWAFGVNTALPVFSLQDSDQLVILYAGAHVGVIYNHTTNSQNLLQGHSNQLSCLCLNEDRRWLATADKGLNSLVIIWDSYSGIPVHTLFDCHPEGGVIAMAFSKDTKLLVTLGAAETQRVCVWDWTVETEKPQCFTILSPQFGFQSYIMFNPNDSTQLLSSSESQVLMYNRTEESLDWFVAEFNKPIDKPVGSYCQSVFQQRKPQTLTATTAGKIVVWDLMKDSADSQSLTVTLTNVISLQKDPITVLTVTDSYIVTGDPRGYIYFYNDDLKILCSFTEFNLDAIASISFSKECAPIDAEGYPESCTLEAEPFIVRDFVVSTFSSTVVHVKARGSIPQILLDEHCDPLHAVACHPTQPAVAVGSYSCILKVWDYNSKLTICRRDFDKAKQIQCLAFDPQGLYLAVGFVSGAIHILNPDTLQSNPDECFHVTEDSIHHITFSADSKYLATADAGKAVTVFRLQVDDILTRWKYLGRHYSHYKPIKDLLFGVQLDSNHPRLLSLGMDRRLVEYDLENSEEHKLLILCSERIEQSAVPLCMIWYPPLTTEQFLLVASDRYKMKLLNSTTKMCRKTILGPTYGSPVEKLVVLPTSTQRDTDSHYLAYITKDKVGLQILPVDGNPYKSNALISHPVGASALSCSYDGRFVFTAGGSDCMLLTWEICLNALEGAAALGGKDMTPFYSLLEGGRHGYFYREMEELFVFCQIRYQGIDYIKKRQLSNKIPLTEVPFLMRALGLFPTEQEIEDMENEVKFSKYADTGKYVTDIDLEEFIKLYINHRPAFNIFTDDLLQTFHTLGVDDGSGHTVLQRDEMLEQLQAKGEHMTEDEVVECFSTLSGLSEQDLDKTDIAESEYSLECVIPQEITMETFTGQILGFPSCAVQSDERSPPAE